MRMFTRWMNRRRATRDASRWRKVNLGAHARLDPTVQVLGWRQTRIGERTVIGEATWLNVNDRESTEIGILIGKNCFIGRRNFFNSGKRIRLGDYCLTGIDCHFHGSDHQHQTPFAPYITTGNTLDGIIDVGANCWFGASVSVMKNVRIGFGSIIGAGAMVTRDLPPYSLAVGNPARILKRFDADRNEWVALEEWTPAAEAQIPSEADYLAHLVQHHPAVKIPAITSGHIHGDL